MTKDKRIWKGFLRRTGHLCKNETAVPPQRLELELLRDLKGTRATKDTPCASGTTPAGVVAALLARARDRNLLHASQPVEPEIIDTDGVQVQEGGDGDE